MSNPDTILNRLLEPIDFIKIEDIIDSADNIFRVFLGRIDDQTFEYPVVIVMTKNEVHDQLKFRNMDWASIHFRKYQTEESAYNVLSKFTSRNLNTFPAAKLGQLPKFEREIVYSGFKDPHDKSKSIYSSQQYPYKVTIRERLPYHYNDTNRLPPKIDFNYLLSYGDDVIVEK